ncbi:MAG: hypothetical protein AAF316_00175 [Cyanobacteria bacterium P01_A01_bin.80]
MTFPLKNVVETHTGTAYYPALEESTDKFGNPVTKELNLPVPVELTLKTGNSERFTSKPSGKILIIYQCFLLTEFDQQGNRINLDNLIDVIDLDNGKKLKIVDTTQSLLKPINKVFGTRFKAYMF